MCVCLGIDDFGRGEEGVDFLVVEGVRRRVLLPKTNHRDSATLHRRTPADNARHRAIARARKPHASPQRPPHATARARGRAPGVGRRRPPPLPPLPPPPHKPRRGQAAGGRRRAPARCGSASTPWKDVCTARRPDPQARVLLLHGTPCSSTSSSTRVCYTEKSGCFRSTGPGAACCAVGAQAHRAPARLNPISDSRRRLG